MRKPFEDNKKEAIPMTDRELVKKAFDMHRFSYVSCQNLAETLLFSCFYS